VNSAVTGSTVGFLVCAAIFLLGAGLWTIVPAVYGLPTVPAPKERVRAALRLAGLKPGETIFDLGAGDGRVLVMAAREFGARAVGIEVGPIQCLLLWLRMQAEGLRDKVEIHWGRLLSCGPAPSGCGLRVRDEGPGAAPSGVGGARDAPRDAAGDAYQ